ncbi:AraC family transcriptional regulator [Ideonella sp. B7]|uniref:AraC family transcriptional regulator n=1 Tax=Ideonella benzenivorans TaxID=2831643 RepID=UPI001CED4852|nr:AraC family transcriptional regulator [Ideonella benzenivorans]MCA6215481.1 AraC family transcriptional regulator [Ideonella benzenivorans]
MPTLEVVPDRFPHASDRASFRRPAALPGVELYRARILRHAFDPHAHDGYGLGMVEAGAQRFHYRGQDHEAPADALVLMQPGELHTGAPACPQGWTYRMLYVDEAVLQAHLGEAAPAWHFREAVRRDARRAQRFGQALGALWEATDAGDIGLQDDLLARCLDLLQPLAEARGPTPGLVADFRPLLARLRDDLAHAWRLPEMATLAGMSPCHFQRSFSAHHQVSPHQWLMAQRLAEAKRLLARGQAPAEAAAAVGLTDQAHLTRRFAAMYGITPARYQREIGVRPTPRG